MSDSAAVTPEALQALFGLPNLDKLFDAIKKAEELWAKVEEYIAKAKEFYAANRAEIDAVLALVKKIVEFFNGLRGETGGGFVG
jgi:hypothetical protein